MQLRTNALVEAFPDLRKELGEKALATISPALIGMSLRQDIPGGLPSGRARFRFSCQDHSGTEHPCYQQKRSERQSVPTCRVSKLDALYACKLVEKAGCSQCSQSEGRLHYIACLSFITPDGEQREYWEHQTRSTTFGQHAVGTKRGTGGTAPGVPRFLRQF